ncbi:MAG TPA: hypothetical protein VJR29_11385 [bacterium]|nr:hypothetical protein [bacterium]
MKRLKLTLISAMLVWALPLLAHDEGHGPKLSDTGNYGGVLTAVVEAKNAPQGAKAPLVYKAELTRSEDSTVRVYIYDLAMKPLPAEALPKTAQASLVSMKGGKESSTPFALNLEGANFTGKAPAPASKPFSIDVTFKTKDRELLAGFDNLD